MSPCEVLMSYGGEVTLEHPLERTNNCPQALRRSGRERAGPVGRDHRATYGSCLPSFTVSSFGVGWNRGVPVTSREGAEGLLGRA
jgi:hypothetical protein